MNFVHGFLLFCVSVFADTDPDTNRSPVSTPHFPRYAKPCEDAVSKQIAYELQAFRLYRRIAYYFDRSDVALPGFHKFFKRASDEELGHADKLMDYQNKRGSKLPYENTCSIISAKPSQQWNTVTEAMELALEEKKKINKVLLDLVRKAEDNSDPHLADFIVSQYLTEHVDSIKQMADYVTILKRVGSGLGEYMVDRQLENDTK